MGFLIMLSSNSNNSGSKDTMLNIEVLNRGGFWVQVSSAYPNESRLPDRLAVALRNNPGATRARAKGNKTGQIYDVT